MDYLTRDCSWVGGLLPQHLFGCDEGCGFDPQHCNLESDIKIILIYACYSSTWWETEEEEIASLRSTLVT